MKKITHLDKRLLSITNDESKAKEQPTPIDIIGLIGSVKADTADDARRTRRLILKIKEPDITEMNLESDDLVFLNGVFEKNAMGLTAWFQGQILDLLESAGKVDAVITK